MPEILPERSQEEIEKEAAKAREAEAERKAREEVVPAQTDRPIPPTIKRPPEQHDYAKELAETQAKERSFEEEQIHQIEQAHKSMQDYADKAKPMLQSVIDAQTHLADEPNVPVDPAIQKQIQAYQQQKPNGVSNIFQLMVMGAMLGVTALGWRRGYGARAGIMQGWGNAFKALAQNKKDLAQEQTNNAYKLQELVRQENQERHQRLMEIYQNRRLNLEQKRDLFTDVQKLYGINENVLKTEANITQQHLKTLQNQERIQRDLYKLQMATHNHLSNFMTQTEPGKEWRARVMVETGKKDSVTGGVMVDPMRGEGDLAQAEELYPYEKFLDTWKAGIGKKDPSDPTGQKKIQEPGFPQKGEEQKPSADSAYKKFKDKYFPQTGQ